MRIRVGATDGVSKPKAAPAQADAPVAAASATVPVPDDAKATTAQAQQISTTTVAEVKKNVEKLAPSAEDETAGSFGVPANRRETRTKINRMRMRIAQRLKDAQNTYAMLTTFNEIDMT